MGEVLCSGFNLPVFSPHDRRGSEVRICIVATKGKMTGFILIDWVYFVYIMSSCLSVTSFFMNLIP